jgi:hypothetical protein
MKDTQHHNSYYVTITDSNTADLQNYEVGTILGPFTLGNGNEVW